MSGQGKVICPGQARPLLAIQQRLGRDVSRCVRSGRWAPARYGAQQERQRLC